jgi:hypothetical protein
VGNNALNQSKEVEMSTRAKKVFLFIGILAGLIIACLGIETCHINHLGWALLFTGTAFIYFFRPSSAQSRLGCFSLL